MPVQQKQKPSAALEHALKAVESMRVVDLAVVPGVPSEPMIMAGALAGQISPETARRVYQAMLAAD
jgi:hypothetical protein